MRREINSNAWLDYLGFPGRLKVSVENQVGAFVETQRHSFGFNIRNRPRLPEEQVAVGIEDVRLDANLHAAKTCAGLGFAGTRGSGTIDENVGVVDIPLISGTNLDCLYPSRLVDWNRENEIPVCVGSLRWKNERLAGGENQVRLSNSPALHKLGLWR